MNKYKDGFYFTDMNNYICLNNTFYIYEKELRRYFKSKNTPTNYDYCEIESILFNSKQTSGCLLNVGLYPYGERVKYTTSHTINNALVELLRYEKHKNADLLYMIKLYILNSCIRAKQIKWRGYNRHMLPNIIFNIKDLCKVYKSCMVGVDF